MAARPGAPVTRGLVSARCGRSWATALCGGQRVAAGGTRQRLMLWRSSLRADCTAVLGPRSRGRTHCAHCVRCVQTNAASQLTKRAAARRPRPCAPRRHRNRPRRVPPAARAPAKLFARKPPRLQQRPARARLCRAGRRNPQSSVGNGPKAAAASRWVTHADLVDRPRVQDGRRPRPLSRDSSDRCARRCAAAHRTRPARHRSADRIAASRARRPRAPAQRSRAPCPSPASRAAPRRRG